MFSLKQHQEAEILRLFSGRRAVEWSKNASRYLVDMPRPRLKLILLAVICRAVLGFARCRTSKAKGM